jgi:hypothetical protein
VTTETLILLRDLLDAVQVSAGHPDFEASALRLIQAKRELREALAAAEASDKKTPKSSN